MIAHPTVPAITLTPSTVLNYQDRLEMSWPNSEYTGCQ